mmetsp:Transcript_13270/g.18191  ORF Transcript_13270/g.18191 Transcript_13270/m.18191 type:complete len:377 (+) Transcript_13270:37-1167(+)
MSVFGEKLNKAFLSAEEYAALSGSSTNVVEQSEGEMMEIGDTAQQLPSEGILIMRGFVVYFFSPLYPFHWTRLPDCRRDRSYFETVYIPSRREIVAISTFNLLASGTVEKFSFDETKWNTISPLPKKYRSVGSCISDSPSDVVYVTGGIDVSTQEVSNTVFCLRNANNSDDSDAWLVCGRLLTPRYRHASAFFGGYVWSVGGILRQTAVLPFGVSEEYSTSVELWDPATGTSILGSPLRQCRAIDCVLLVLRGTLFVVGGDVGKAVETMEGDKESLAVYTIDRFDPSSNAWVAVTQFPSQRRGFTAAAFGDSIYVFGGRSGNCDLSSWDAYHVVNNTWLSASDSLELQKQLHMPIDCLYGSAVTFNLNATAAAEEV